MIGVSRRARLAAAIMAAPAAILAAGPASAHAFGERYDLPVPLWLYFSAAAAVVLLSFVVVALVERRPAAAREPARIVRSPRGLGGWLTHPWLIAALELVAVGLFALVILAGLFGNPHPGRNVAPTFVWILWWVGFALISAFLGDLWVVVNPWRILYAWAEAALRRWRRTGPGYRGYPESWGSWPAFAFLLIFAWIEIVHPDSADPATIAWLAIVYSLLTWAAMARFGAEAWLRHGEMFAVVFGVLARFAPLARVTIAPERIAPGARYRGVHAPVGEERMILRPHAVGLLGGEAVSASLMAVVLLMLAAVLFDGLMGTQMWRVFENWLYRLRPREHGVDRLVLRTLGLIGAWLALQGAYLLTCWAMSRLTGVRESGLALARDFALTLVPIAIGYQVAHYLTYLLVPGQAIIALASDPFGRGWNLFGTAGYEVDIGFVGARFAWYTAVIAIVIGHVIAVYLAHRVALRRWAERRRVLAALAPMTLLMILYTVISLSILAEPLVRRSAPPDPSYSLAPTAFIRG